MSDLTEEILYICSVDGCDNCVFDEAYKRLGCAIHGNTFVRIIRQFEAGKMVREFPKPGDSK